MPKDAPHISTLILLAAVSTLSLNMFLPALPSIAADLSAPMSQIVFAASGYLAMTALVQLVAGPLSDRIGRRPVVLGALAIFALASVLCALATSAPLFLLARMAQAAVVSCFVLSLAIVRDTQTDTRTAQMIAYVTSAMALAPMVGPMIGGGIDVTLGWRAIFWAYAIAGIGLLLLCLRGLTETAPATSAARRSAFDLLRNPAFLAYAFCTAFSTSTFYVFITGTPLVLGTQFNMDAAQIGLGIGSITAGFMAGSFLSGRLADAVPTMRLILTGRLIACAGLTVGLGLAMTQVITPILFFAATIWVGVGNGLTMPGTNTKAMSIDPSRAGAAAGLSGALTVLLGAVLTQLMGQILGTPYDLPLLIAVMLGTAALGLAAALWARGLAPQARVPLAKRSTPPSR